MRGTLVALSILAVLGAPVVAVASTPVHVRPAPATCSAAGAVHVRPGQPVRAVVAHAPTGATICFGRGVYRLRAPIRPRTGQTLVGAGAVLSGARVLHGFRRTGDAWSVGGQRQQGERTGTCSRGTACTLPDGVLRDGRPLRHVLHRSGVARGGFWFDYAHDRIVVGADPRGHRLEAMVAPAAVLSRSPARGSGVTVRGFVVQGFATRAQHGALETGAPGWVVERCVVRLNHGAGITAAGRVRIVDNRVLRNGQLGIGGTGPSTYVAGNEIAGNNTAGFDPGWEAGGAKWAVTDGLVVRRNRVHDNRGPGLWTDIDAQHTTYADNVVRDNARAGIFHEISAAAEITGNVVTGNGHGYPSWLWGSGILVAASHDVRVADNRLSGNAEGIGLVQQDRGTSDVDGEPRVLHDVAVTDNTVTMSGGDSGAVQDDGYRALFSDPTITWSANTWHGTGTAPFAWDDDELTPAGWRALGHDTDGHFDKGRRPVHSPRGRTGDRPRRRLGWPERVVDPEEPVR